MPVPMHMVGIQDRFGESGTPDELFAAFGLTAENVAWAAEEVLRAKRDDIAQGIRASLDDSIRYASLLLYAQTSVRNVLVDPSVVGGNPALCRQVREQVAASGLA